MSVFEDIKAEIESYIVPENPKDCEFNLALAIAIAVIDKYIEKEKTNK